MIYQSEESVSISALCMLGAMAKAHVKCRKVIPHAHIQRLLPLLTMLPQPLQQQINIPPNHRLLLAHTPVTKPMRQLPPQLPVQLAVRRDQVLRHIG